MKNGSSKSTNKEESMYGQYCPLAMSAEFLCARWTMLILRELMLGASSFNDIGRGVPRMSRSLLSTRLKELIQAGIVKKQTSNNHISYQLTQAGKALRPIVLGMAEWGQKWLKVEPSLRDLDVGLLMWDIRRNTRPIDALPDPFIVEFYLTDVVDNQSHHWLIFKDGDVDLCHIDHGFDVDVYIEVSIVQLTKVWMGWECMQSAINASDIVLRGKPEYTKTAEQWLGQSIVADVSKVSVNCRI